MPREVVLRVTGVTKSYPGVQALGGVDLEVAKGEVHCLLGQNGAGKSTLIKTVSGIVTPDTGTVELDGVPLPTGNPAQAMRRGVATIYQELDLVPGLKAYENVFLGHETTKAGLLDRSADIKRCAELFEQLGHPELDPEAVVETLPPAKQQVVCMARALSHDVKLLILDEPSSILDGDEVEILFRTVESLATRGIGILYITHRLHEVARIGDIVTVLKDGRTVKQLAADAPQDDLVEGMVGRNIDKVFPVRSTEIGAPVLSVSDLSRDGEFSDISLQVRAGEVVGIAGLVGTGRTEVLRCIYGLSKPAKGSVSVAGTTLKSASTSSSLDAGVVMAPEERKSQGLVLDWELDKNVSLPTLKRFSRLRLLNLRSERKAAAEALRSLGTRPDNPSAHARTLSGGNQQKVVLARWLLHGCKVMLLDEPTRGIDVEAKSEIYKQIREFTNNGGAALVVSSEFPELLGLCDRILVMREGRLVAEFAGDAVTEEHVLAAALGAEVPPLESAHPANPLTQSAPAKAATKKTSAKKTAAKSVATKAPAKAPAKTAAKAVAKKAPAKAAATVAKKAPTKAAAKKSPAKTTKTVSKSTKSTKAKP